MPLSAGKGCLVAVLVLSAPAAAQRDTIPWISRRDAVAGLTGIAATFAVAPFDGAISREFTEAPWRRGSALHRVADKVAVLGGSGPLMVSAALYAVGVGGDFPALSRVALHTVEAIALAGSVAGVVRGFTGRALPNVSAEDQFSFGRGFHDNNGPFVSFPSGHTAAAFAVAATISGEVGRAKPALAVVVTPLAFTAATAVGFARVAQRVHWPTDLPLGAVIGLWSGHVVQSHVYGRGLAASAIRGLTIAPAPDHRMLIGWSLQMSDAVSQSQNARAAPGIALRR
ncbi:MAG TPA: phosphatase PAP2 family protein [Gemmatimonadaceae bacterium]